MPLFGHGVHCNARQALNQGDRGNSMAESAVVSCTGTPEGVRQIVIESPPVNAPWVDALADPLRRGLHRLGGIRK